MERVKTAFVLVLVELALLCLFALLVDYDLMADASDVRNSISKAYGGLDPDRNSLKNYYASTDLFFFVFFFFFFFALIGKTAAALPSLD